jgi:hypothetical protein
MQQTMKQLRKLLGSRVVPFCTSAAEALPPAAAASPSHAKALGFLGAIPFIGLSSPVVDQVGYRAQPDLASRRPTPLLSELDSSTLHPQPHSFP